MLLKLDGATSIVSLRAQVWAESGQRRKLMISYRRR
jgi:hypothetical protein